MEFFIKRDRDVTIQMFPFLGDKKRVKFERISLVQINKIRKFEELNIFISF